MARLPRLAVAGRAHYLLQRSVHGQPLATDDADRRLLLDAIAESARVHEVALWAYAIGEQELHLLACPATDAALGRMMQTLGRRYVGAFNRRHARSGALWGGRYRAAPIEDGEWLLAAMRMIDSVPGASGRWSSAPHHLGQVRHPILSDAPVLWTLGNTPFERELNYRKALEEGVPAETAARIRAALGGGWAVGSATFIATVGAQSARPAAPRARGRPRRE